MRLYGLIDFDSFSILADDKTGQMGIFTSAKEAETFKSKRVNNPERYDVAYVDVTFLNIPAVPTNETVQ